MLLVRLSFLALFLTSCASIRRDPLAGSLQALIVVTDDANVRSGTMHRWERDSARGRWRDVGPMVSVVVGRNGVAPEGEKREGDGRSPGGSYSLGTAFGFIPSAFVRFRYPYRQLGPTTECVDDSASRYYNQIVDRDAVPVVDWSSSEKMHDIWQYRLGIVVNHNMPPVPQRGSCIFLHISSGPLSTTAGCTAMSERDLETLLRWLDPAKQPRLVQFTREESLSFHRR